MAIVTKQKYTQEKIDKLLDYLNLYKDKDQSIDYEILVDGFKAVRRTSDPEMFNIYDNFVTPESKVIEVLFYTGTSNNNDKYIFILQEEPKEQGLSGIEIDNRIQEGIEKEKRNWEFDDLRKKNKELKEEVSELEAEIQQLEKDKLELQAKESPFKSMLGEVGATFVETFIRKNTRLLAKLPGGDTLAGIVEEDNREKELEEQHEPTEVSFRSRSSTKAIVSEEDQYAITFVKQLKSSFTKPEFDSVLEILEQFAIHKQIIETTLSTLKNTSHD